MTSDPSATLTSLCVFCGSSPGVDPLHGQAARRLGGLLAAEGLTLVYGGGNLGMMGMLAEGAAAAGGRVIGVIPEHLTGIEAPSAPLGQRIVVDSMHTRKRRMFDLSDAFCVLPGGLGTLDETFEILTWKQLGLHAKPIVIANLAGFWGPWLDLVAATVAGGFTGAAATGLFTVVDGVDQVLAAARRELAGPAGGPSGLF